MMFQKAYALMKISADPLNFIQHRIDIEEMVQDVKVQDLEPDQEARTTSKPDQNVKLEEPDRMTPTTTKQDQNEAFKYYLNKRMRLVTPQFLRAWWILRNHIQQWELRYFYEVCFHHILNFYFLSLCIIRFYHKTADSADHIVGDRFCFVDDIGGVDYGLSRGV